MGALAPFGCRRYVSKGMRKNNFQALLFFVGMIFMFLLCSCQFSENRHLKREVKRNELIGTWIATPFAIKCLQWSGFKNHLATNDHQLVLNENGSCRYKSFQNFFIISGSTPKYLDVDDCKWELISKTEHQQQYITITLSSSPEGSGGPYFYFDEKDKKLILWQYCSDPDQWKYMEFFKVDSKNKKT